MAYRILVVDDNRFSLEFIPKWLKDVGYEVVCARDGAEAFDLLMGESFDLMLLDLQMPKVNGIELLRHLTEARVSLPTLIMTGLSTVMSHGLSEAEEEVVGKYPATCGYLPKPFSVDRLFHTVERMLEKDADGRSDET